jgi:hypothetical protein
MHTRLPRLQGLPSSGANASCSCSSFCFPHRTRPHVKMESHVPRQAVDIPSGSRPGGGGRGGIVGWSQRLLSQHIDDVAQLCS